MRLLWVVAMGWEGFYGTPNRALFRAAVRDRREEDILGVELATIGQDLCEVDFRGFREGDLPSLRKSIRKAVEFAEQDDISEVFFYVHRLMVWRTRLLAGKLVPRAFEFRVIPVDAELYPLASQVWVRSPFLFVLREIPILFLELIGISVGS